MQRVIKLCCTRGIKEQHNGDQFYTWSNERNSDNLLMPTGSAASTQTIIGLLHDTQIYNIGFNKSNGGRRERERRSPICIWCTDEKQTLPFSGLIITTLWNLWCEKLLRKGKKWPGSRYSWKNKQTNKQTNKRMPYNNETHMNESRLAEMTLSELNMA